MQQTPDSTTPHALIVTRPIVLRDLADRVMSDHMGAVVTFEGVVRDHDHGDAVSWLHYTGHPTAEEAITTAAHTIASAYPTVSLAVEHRIGDLVVGDIALGCVVASAHRSDAFAACSALVDLVKETVPIWKKQGFTDGGTEWVGAAHTTT